MGHISHEQFVALIAEQAQERGTTMADLEDVFPSGAGSEEMEEYCQVNHFFLLPEWKDQDGYRSHVSLHMAGRAAEGTVEGMARLWKFLTR